MTCNLGDDTRRVNPAYAKSTLLKIQLPKGNGEDQPKQQLQRQTRPEEIRKLIAARCHEYGMPGLACSIPFAKFFLTCIVSNRFEINYAERAV